jgi:hypothetical protein
LAAALALAVAKTRKLHGISPAAREGVAKFAELTLCEGVAVVGRPEQERRVTPRDQGADWI